VITDRWSAISGNFERGQLPACAEAIAKGDIEKFQLSLLQFVLSVKG
jgi:hypothetical protein